MNTNDRIKIENLEDAYTDLARTIGPLWGETEQREMDRMAAELLAEYDRHDVAEFDRLAI
jgi:hypothetical protein